MLSVDWLELPAELTGLPPDAISEFTSSVDSLVSCKVNEFKVFESVVLLVSVGVMDAESFGDWSVGLLPDPVVGEDIPS